MTSYTMNKLKAEIELLKTQRNELLEAMEFGRTAIGEHIAPSDCYATGPLTGNYIEDFIVCPACRFISAYEKAIAKAKGEV